MHIFTFNYHKGIGPITFGMTSKEVSAVLKPYGIEENVVQDRLVDSKSSVAILENMMDDNPTEDEKKTISDSITMFHKIYIDVLTAGSNVSILYDVSNALCVSYIKDTVSFIGCSSMSEVTFLYRGRDVHRTLAKEIHVLIVEGESKKYSYQQEGYVYTDQIITTWEADTQYDRSGGEKREIWGQVGLGDERYLETVPTHDL